MKLESILVNQPPHQQFYRKTLGKKPIQLKDFPTLNTKYAIDTCILLNPIDVFFEISKQLEEHTSEIRNIPHLIENTYMQVKSLNNLLENNNLLTTPEIINEFFYHYHKFKTQNIRLQNLLEKIPKLSEKTSHYQNKIVTEMVSICRNIPDTQFEDSILIKDMIQKFKKTPYYVKTLNFKKFNEKEISDQDLSLIMLANHTQNQTPNTPVYIVTGDKMFLAQGPVKYKRKKLITPKILLSQYNPRFGRNIQDSFNEHKIN